MSVALLARRRAGVLSRFLTLVLALVVLAILQAAVAALMLALTIMLMFYLVTRPRETLAVVGILMVFGLASARPVAFTVTVGIVAVAVVVLGGRRRSARARQTTSGQKDDHHDPERLERIRPGSG